MTDAYKLFFDYVGSFFILYMIGYASFLFLSVTVGSSTLYQLKRRNDLKNELSGEYYVPVTIVVPAYNEEVTIEASIRSLLALDYKLYEIIIVDDGSRDLTSQTVINAFELHQVNRPIHRSIPCQPEELIYESYAWKVPITLICKKNGGKADALNMGINVAKYPYFICMDVDSVLQHDSLEKIVRPVLEDGHVVAVGGAVRPCNGTEIRNGHVVAYHLPRNILPCMQVLEYDRSFLASRILFDKFNGSIIISGAFGLFHKSTVIAAGGYDPTTMGEDMELVVKLHVYCREHDLPYRIRYATDAICWTQAPESLRDLCKQRKRWHIGLFQCMTRHKRMLANSKYGLVGMISYLYFLIYALLSPYIEVFGLITVLIAFALNLVNIPFMVLFFFVYVIYSSILSLTAFFARIHQLEQELQESNQRFEAQKQEQLRISSTLQEAEHYAEVLHKQAEAEEQHEQEVWQKQLDLKCRELNRYQDQISSLHDLFHTLLCSMEEQTSALLQQAQSIKNPCSDRHMALFERTSEPHSKSQE